MAKEKTKELGISAKMTEVLSKFKTYGIILSILLIILGICIMCNPFQSNVVIVWLLIAGLFIRSISTIVVYFKSPKEFRNGLDLALAIIWAVICLFFILNVFDISLQTTVAFETIFAFAICFVMIFSGINSICNCNEETNSKALMIITGILEILVGIFLLSCPVLTTLTITVFYGIFILVIGISMLIRSLSIKTK